VAVGFFGDGATSQPDFHNAMNFAGVYKVPAVLVCQNNHWAISCRPASRPRRPRSRARPWPTASPAFGSTATTCSRCTRRAREAAASARAGGGPTLIECVTYRIGAHSRATTPRATATRPRSTRGERRTRSSACAHLVALGLVDDASEARPSRPITAEIAAAVNRSRRRPRCARAALRRRLRRPARGTSEAAPSSGLAHPPRTVDAGRNDGGGARDLHVAPRRTRGPNHGEDLRRDRDRRRTRRLRLRHPPRAAQAEDPGIEKDSGAACASTGAASPRRRSSRRRTSYERAKHGHHGHPVGRRAVDAAKMQDWKNGIVKKLTTGVQGLLRATAPRCSRAPRAHRREHRRGRPAEGTVRRRRPPRPSSSRRARDHRDPGLQVRRQEIISAKEAVSLNALPKRMLVIGGGIIGLELGGVYQKLGVELTVVEFLPRSWPAWTPTSSRRRAQAHGQVGRRSSPNAKALGYEKQRRRLARGEARRGRQDRDPDTDVVLVAVGMRPTRGPRPREGRRRPRQARLRADPTSFAPTCRASTPSATCRAAPASRTRRARRARSPPRSSRGTRPRRTGSPSPAPRSPTPRSPRWASRARGEGQGHRRQGRQVPLRGARSAMAVMETDGFVKVIADAEHKDTRCSGCTSSAPRRGPHQRGALGHRDGRLPRGHRPHGPPAPDARRSEHGGPRSRDPRPEPLTLPHHRRSKAPALCARGLFRGALVPPRG
jgi:hypothetical protein